MLSNGDLSSAWAKGLDKIEGPLASKISGDVEFKETKFTTLMADMYSRTL
jgi:hypothetical protein